LGQVAGTVGADPSRQRRIEFGKSVSRVTVDKFGQAAAQGEGESPYALVYQFREQEGRFTVGAAAGILLFVDYRRIPENEILLPVRGSIIIDYGKGQTGEFFGMN
jgi:hypothetical protein